LPKLTAVRRASSLVSSFAAEGWPGWGGTDIGFLPFLIERLTLKG
jgi:hypothetical protein